VLTKCANKCVNILYQYQSLPIEDKPVYIYGFELTLSTIVSFVSIIIYSLFTHNLSDPTVFFLSFFVLRLFCGGYHASTFGKCYLLTNSVFVVISVTTTLIIDWSYYYFLYSIPIASTIIIWCFSPITNKNHPITHRTFLANKKHARRISIVLLSVILIALWFPCSRRIYIFASIAYGFVAIMMIKR